MPEPPLSSAPDQASGNVSELVFAGNAFTALEGGPLSRVLKAVGVRIGAFTSNTIEPDASMCVPVIPSIRGSAKNVKKPSPRCEASSGGRKPANGSAGSRPVCGSSERKTHETAPVWTLKRASKLTFKGVPSKLTGSTKDLHTPRRAELD